jgi:hypothetical protein
MIAWLRRQLARLAAFIHAARERLEPLSDLRITLLLLLLGGGVVIGLSQGRDVVAGLVDEANSVLGERGFTQSADASILRWSAFWAACMWTGVSAWYWSNLLYKTKRGEAQPLWFSWFRRTLGIAPLLCAIIALIVVARGDPGEIWIALLTFGASTILLWLFFAWRRKRRIAAGVGQGPVRLRPRDRWFIGGSAAFSALMLILFIIPGWRTEVAWALGPAAVAFGAIGCIIPVTSLLIWWTRSIRLPIVAIGLVLLVLFSGFNDNHAVRTLPGELGDRVRLDAALRRWEAVHGPDDPIVLVAAAGGASRAAYWTGTVLRALEDADRSGGFAHDVFAISSVSGGSLGAVGYSAWVAERQAAGGPFAASRRDRLQFVRDFFGADYLGPSVAGLLFPDLMQRFLPFPLMPSRAESLEEAWEMSWRRSALACRKGAGTVRCPDPNRLSGDFLDIWRGVLDAPPAHSASWVPLALVNGTHVQTGKRIITAPIVIEPALTEDSYDFFSLLRRPIPASTAIHNSARFPIVSPAGTMKATGASGHIIDGGYFENGGLETLIDLARHIRAAGNRRRILIIEINNDDLLGRGDSARCPRTGTELCHLPVQPPPKADSSPWLGEITAIIGGLYRTRDGRAVLAAKRASVANGVGNVEYFQFKLNELATGRRTAMSWALSLSSRDYMDVVFGATPEQVEEMLEGRDYTAERRRRTIGELGRIASSPLSQQYRATVERITAQLPTGQRMAPAGNAGPTEVAGSRPMPRLPFRARPPARRSCSNT